MYNLVNWVYPFGEEDERFREKLCEYIATGKIFNDNLFESRMDFEQRYQKYLPEKLNTFCYGVSGSEAVEHALMIAEWVTNKSRFMFFSGAYHGSSICLLDVTYPDKFSNSSRFEFTEVAPPYCYRCGKKCNNYKCIDEIFDNIMVGNDIAAIIIDPSFGNILLDPGKEYFQKLQHKCKQREIMIIFDEVRTAYGRLGYKFAFEKYDIVPDILCVSKAIACGLPLSLTIYDGDNIITSKKMQFHYMMETTFAGFELGLKMANYTLERIHNSSEEWIPVAEYFSNQLKQLKRYNVVGDVRSNGMIFALEFIDSSTSCSSRLKALQFVRAVRKKGVLINDPGYSSVVLIHPNISIKKQEIDIIISIFIECLESICTKRKD